MDDPTDRLDSNCRFYAMAVRDCNGRGLDTRSLDMRLGRMEVLSLEVRPSQVEQTTENIPIKPCKVDDHVARSPRSSTVHPRIEPHLERSWPNI